MRFIKLTGIIALLFALAGCWSQTNFPTDLEISAANPRNDLYYEIFVRSFSDSDGDGIGDLKGITERLDYLADLGIGGIWLMPIHPSPSYHGYDVMDYYAINDDYGTMEDFEELVSEAKKRDIQIMIDLVINHTSDQHPWFLAAKKNDLNYADWYIKKGTTFYSYFGSSMPDLNLSNDEVVNEIKNIMDFWLGKGVGGFRLDAAKHFFTYEDPIEIVGASPRMNYIFIDKLRDYARTINPDVLFVSEVLDSETWYKQFYTGSDSLFNFDMINSIINIAQYGNVSIVNPYITRLQSFYEDFYEYNKEFIDAPLLSNHDRNRLAEYLNGDIEKQKMAAEMYLLLPGSPFIYYGEELGMFGYRVEGVNFPGYGTVYDETRRLPFPWGNGGTTTWITTSSASAVYNDRNKTIAKANEQMENSNSLLATYQALGQLRKNNIALKYGNNFVPLSGTPANVQGFYRYYEYEGRKQLILVILNLSLINSATIEGVSYREVLYGQNDYTSSGNSLTVEKQSTLVLELDPSLWENIQL